VQKRNAGILRCAQNDKQKVQKQIPPLRCGMTKEQTTTNEYRDSGCARMTISNGLRSWPDDNEWDRFIAQFLGKRGETDLWWGSLWV
jgi:hypothetical protein